MENDNELELRRENRAPAEEESGVSFSDIWHMIIKHWVALVVSIFVCALAGGVYGKAIKKPVWQATAEAFVVTQVSDTGTTTGTNGVNQNDYQYAVTLIPSVVAFMNSNTVINDVTEKINTSLNKDYDTVTIKKMVSASSDNYSTASLRSVYITINAKSSNQDFSIALANQFLDSAIDIANTSETNPYFKNKILESSRPSKTEKDGKVILDAVSDSSMSTKKIVLIAAAIGLVIGIAYGIIFELCNTHVISNKEIEQLTGFKVIGTIPDLDPKTEDKIRKNSKKSGGHM